MSLWHCSLSTLDLAIVTNQGGAAPKEQQVEVCAYYTPNLFKLFWTISVPQMQLVNTDETIQALFSLATLAVPFAFT